MPEYLKLKLEPGETELYIPAADAYINIREDGAITIKKASGQETYQCHSWRLEESKIRRYKAAQQFTARFLSFLK